jgi:hypothetical protein
MPVPRNRLRSRERSPRPLPPLAVRGGRGCEAGGVPSRGMRGRDSRQPQHGNQTGGKRAHDSFGPASIDRACCHGGRGRKNVRRALNGASRPRIPGRSK